MYIYLYTWHHNLVPECSRLNRELLISSTNLFLLHTIPHFRKWGQIHSCLSLRLPLVNPTQFVLYKLQKIHQSPLQSVSGMHLLSLHCHSRRKPHHLSVGLQRRSLVNVPAPVCSASTLHTATMTLFTEPVRLLHLPY